MAFGTSGFFRQTSLDAHNNIVVLNLDLETHKVALFGNSVTPDYDAIATAAKYGTGGTWTTANEVTGTNYTAGGALLTSTAVTAAAATLWMWDAADTAWATATISNVYGCLIYADAMTTPVADQAILGVAFGGAFAVTAGTFTIQWSANGIYRLTP